jgi:hypothetical protein
MEAFVGVISHPSSRRTLIFPDDPKVRRRSKMLRPIAQIDSRALPSAAITASLRRTCRPLPHFPFCANGSQHIRLHFIIKICNIGLLKHALKTSADKTSTQVKDRKKT